MALQRNYHGLSESGVFYRDREDWCRHVATCVEYDASTRLIGMHIALRVGPKTREAWHTQRRIARDLKLSVPTVKRAVAQLVRDGRLSVVKKVPRGGRKKAVNHYSLVHPADQGITLDPSDRYHP